MEPQPKPRPSPTWRQTAGRFGQLDCTVCAPESGVSPRFCVILCHGFGAPGTDLVPLASELTSMHAEHSDSVVYLFPQAPLDLSAQGFAAGRAWWMIDIERFQRAMERPAEMVRLAREVPAGLPESSKLLEELVADVQVRMGIPISRMLLGGFSQGAMLATDVSLRLADAPAGLCIFSGTLVAEEEWRNLAQRRGPLRVLQSHGRFDPLLPIASAEALRDLLLKARLEVEFLPFAGPHTIPYKALERLALLLQRLVAERCGG